MPKKIRFALFLLEYFIEAERVQGENRRPRKNHERETAEGKFL